MRVSLILTAALGCTLIAAPAAGAENAPDPLAPLKALVGQWQGTSSEGRRLDITYRLIANDTALVETWRSPSGRETMTVYHRDGSDLLATHYCAQGNQPRLKLLAETQGGRMRFRFRDATNLAAPQDSHLHEFWLEPTGVNEMRRSETYAAGAERSEESAVLKRGVADSGQ